MDSKWEVSNFSSLVQMSYKQINKKGIVGPVISVFVMVLIVSILAGLTFLFITGLKNNVTASSAYTGVTVANETGSLSATPYSLSGSSALGGRSFVISVATNATSGAIIPASNYTVSSTGVVTETAASVVDYATANYSYTYSYINAENDGAYLAVNGTEAAGSTVVNYLALIFLAIIFGAILTLVLRVILPYINLGQQAGGF